MDSEKVSWWRNEDGQATVEFAIVMAAFLAVLVAGGVAFRAFEQGIFVEHAVYSASHHLEGDIAGAVSDVFLF